MNLGTNFYKAGTLVNLLVIIFCLGSFLNVAKASSFLNPSALQKLETGVISSIAIDGQVLWVGSENGLYKVVGDYSEKIASFEEINHSGHISSVHAGKSAVWLSLYGSGLFRFDKQSETFEFENIDTRLNEFLWTAVSNKNRIVASYVSGLILYDASTSKVIYEYDAKSHPNLDWSSTTILKAFNKFAFSVSPNNLIRVDFETGELKALDRSSSLEKLSSITTFDVHGNGIIVGGPEGLYHLNKQFVVERFVAFAAKPLLPPSEIFVDLDKNIWVAAGGIYLQQEGLISAVQFMNPFLDSSRIKTVTGIDQMPNGRLLIVSSQQGIVALPREYKGTNYLSSSSTQVSFNIYAVADNIDAKALVASDTGYYLLDKTNGNLYSTLHLPLVDSSLLFLGNNNFLDLYNCRLIKAMGATLSEAEQPNEEVMPLCGRDSVVINNQMGYQLVLHNNLDVRLLSQFDSNGALQTQIIVPRTSYLADISATGTIAVLDNKNQILIKKNEAWIGYSTSESNSLEHSCLSISSDKIFFCSSGGGLGVMDFAGNVRFFNPNLTNSSRFIRDVEKIGNKLWVATNKGLSQLNLDTNIANSLKHESGIFDQDFDYRSLYSLSDNKLLVSGDNWGYLIDTSVLSSAINERNTLTHSAKLVSISANQKKYSAPELIQPDSLELPTYLDNLDFLISIADFGSNRRLNIQYRLLGLSDSWITIPNSHAWLSFPEIKYGQYELQYRAVDESSQATQPLSKIGFTVLPPFYMTKLAKQAYIITGLVLLCGAGVWYTYYLRRRQYSKTEAVKTKLTALQDNNDSLQRLLEHKHALMANISHEIRTPLMLVTEPLKNIVKQINDKETLKQYELITRNADRVSTLVEQLLEVERLSCLREVPCHEYDIHDTATYVIESVRPLAEQKQQTVIFRSYAKGVITLYQDTLQQIFYNLVSNAVKYSPPSSEIVITTKLKDSNVMISVKDQGPGLTEKEIRMMFDRFARLEGASSEQGIGIGLSLVKQLIKANSGHIEAVSLPDKGVEFIVALPLDKPQPSSETITKEAEEKPVLTDEKLQLDLPAEDTKQPILLIAEDSAELRNFLHGLFKHDYNCFIAKNGVEALEAACHLQPDIILTDLMMPRMTGIELAKAIREHDMLSHTAIFMLTGMGDQESVQAGHNVFVDEYIIKPFNQDILLQKVKNRLILNQKMRESVASAMGTSAKPDDFFAAIPKLAQEKDQQFYVKLRTCLDKYACDSEFNRSRCASKMNVCERQLNRKLEVVCGMSFVETLKTYRVFKAKIMLKDGCSVTDTSYDCGFSTPSYFSTVFKSHTGKSPKQFAA